jgi:hypothetical protein
MSSAIDTGVPAGGRFGAGTSCAQTFTLPILVMGVSLLTAAPTAVSLVGVTQKGYGSLFHFQTLNHHAVHGNSAVKVFFQIKVRLRGSTSQPERYQKIFFRSP